MKKKVRLIIFLLAGSLLLVSCSGKKSDNQTLSKKEEVEVEKEESVDTSENSRGIISAMDFENGIAVVEEENPINGDTQKVAIDVEGNELFVLPETESIISPNVDLNGEYLWWEGAAFKRNGETIYDAIDKYRYSDLGNGYVLVKEILSGYEQKTEKMGVIDGYGNEIIPLSEELSELCKGEMLNIGGDRDYCGEGIGYDKQTKMLIDANQGVYYKLDGDIKEYRDGNVLVYGGVLYRNQGTSKVRIDRKSELTLSEDKVVAIEGSDSDGYKIKTYDLDGNIVNETQLNNIVLENKELKYDNGSSALYIRGKDGYYVTMIDEYGNFKFEPIKHENHVTDNTNFEWSEVSEGLLRVAEDETTTIFVNEKGEEVIEIPYNIECVGNCKNGRIAVNTTEKGFYINADTGEYIEKINEK